MDNNGETNRTSISKLITSTPRNVPVMHHSPDASPIKTSSDIHVPFDQCDRNSSYGDSKSFKKLGNVVVLIKKWSLIFFSIFNGY